MSSLADRGPGVPIKHSSGLSSRLGVEAMGSRAMEGNMTKVCQGVY